MPISDLSSLSRGFASFLPDLVLARFGGAAEAPSRPELRRGPGVVLFADISGFTALAERLTARGAQGTEELTALLNGYFGRLIQVITSHRGDVMKFAGDALLAVWWAEGDMARTARRAASCALSVQAAMVSFAEEANAALSLRIGVGAGEVLALFVGVEGSQWECVPTGEPLRQMGRALNEAARGEVVLSPEVWALVSDACEGSPRGDGCVRLGAAGPEGDPVQTRTIPPLQALDALVPFVQPSIRDRVRADLADWLSELRRVTVLFVNLLDLDPAAPDHLERTQVVFRVLHTVLARHEGTVNKLSVDDKGMVALAALGLPPLSHADDPVRGVLAALAVREALAGEGIRCAIGVTTGRVFCGVVGSDTRREYTVMGDPVNQAARLMQHAGDGILCDTATRDAALGRVVFEDREPLVLKGKALPVAVCRPVEEIRDAGRRSGRIVGREAEQALLQDALDALKQGGSGLVLLEGETGAGKTRLVVTLHDMLALAHIRALTGASDSLETATPYYPWRDLVAELLGLNALDPGDANGRRERVLAQAGGDHVLARLAPLLRDLVDVDLPDNELTAAMTGEVRAYNVQDLVVHLLRFAAAEGPLVLVLEDAHWFDSASWALLRRVHDAVSPLLTVLSLRPLTDPLPAEYLRLRDAASTRRIRLEPLTRGETSDLLALRLGSPPSEDLSQQVHARAEGNPFFTEVLGLTLQESGLLEVRDGRLHLTSSTDALHLPDTIQGTILARIDRLEPRQQLLIKVASVIGRSFAVPVLDAVYPVEGDRPGIPGRLRELERLDITFEEMPEPDLVYMYRHETTREVAYSLLLFAQRRKLHQAVAEALEAANPGDRAALFGRLAWHWGLAEDTEKHVFYLEKAGEHAVQAGAYKEATRFLADALEKGGAAARPLRRAHWERLLGEAWLGLGNLPESRAALERAVAILGFPVPASTPQLVGSLARGVVRQVGFRIRAPSPRPPDEVEVLRVAALAYLRVLETYFFLATTPETLNAALWAVNIAQMEGPSPELARSYALFAWIISMVPAFALSDLYLRHAAHLVELPEGRSAVQPVRFFTGFCRIAAGRWKEGHEALDEAVALAERIGDKRRFIEAVCGWSTLVHYEGQYARRVRMGADVLYASARRQGDFQAEAWGLMDQAESLLALGEQDRAMALLDALVPFLEEAIGRSEQIWGHGLRAVGLWRANRRDDAHAAAGRAVAATATTDPVAVYTFEGYAGAADVLSALWEASPSEDLGSETRAAVKALEKYARVFPIAQPRALLFRGLVHHLEGHASRAERTWLKALAEAQRLKMPYDEGRALLELGRHRPRGSDEGRAWLDQAEAVFTGLSAAWDLGRVRAALEVPG